MMRNLLALTALCAFLTVGITVSAEEGEEGAKKPKPEKPVAPKTEEMTLKGKIEKKGYSFTLVCADDSSVRLPAIPKAAKDAEPGPKYEDFVGKEVEVVGKGVKNVVRGKEVVVLKSVSSVKEVAGAGDEKKPAEKKEAGGEK